MDGAELLGYIRKFLSQQEVATRLGVDARTVRRWESGGVVKPALLPALRSLAQARGVRDEGPAPFTFIDLFAGIGGIRLGFEEFGGKCVFTSEWNKFAAQTYRANFQYDSHEIAGDI